MKTIVQKEQIKYDCDGCGIPLEAGVACSVDFYFGYGSPIDGTRAEYHFCYKCAEPFYKDFEQHIKIIKSKTHINSDGPEDRSES
jgi:hypothetical protein